MDIFFFAAFIGLFAVAVNYLTVRKVEECRGHKWSRDEIGMICETCNKRPGQF